MKSKLFLSISLVILLSFSLCANASVKYLGSDRTTQGDWVGKYGANGVIIFCNKDNHNANLPVPYNIDETQKLAKKGLISELSITGSGTGQAAYGWIFNATPGDAKNALWLVDKSARYAACISGRNADVAMTLKVDSTHYKVTIYCTDYDTTARAYQAFGYQGNTIPAQPDEEINKYTNGIYTSWEVTGSDPFKYLGKNLAPSVNNVASGLFIDDMGAVSSVQSNDKLPSVWGHIKDMP